MTRNQEIEYDIYKGIGIPVELIQPERRPRHLRITFRWRQKLKWRARWWDEDGNIVIDARANTLSALYAALSDARRDLRRISA